MSGNKRAEFGNHQFISWGVKKVFRNVKISGASWRVEPLRFRSNHFHQRFSKNSRKAALGWRRPVADYLQVFIYGIFAESEDVLTECKLVETWWSWFIRGTGGRGSDPEGRTGERFCSCSRTGLFKLRCDWSGPLSRWHSWSEGWLNVNYVHFLFASMID